MGSQRAGPLHQSLSQCLDATSRVFENIVVTLIPYEPLVQDDRELICKRRVDLTLMFGMRYCLLRPRSPATNTKAASDAGADYIVSGRL